MKTIKELEANGCNKCKIIEDVDGEMLYQHCKECLAKIQALKDVLGLINELTKTLHVKGNYIEVEELKARIEGKWHHITDRIGNS